MILKNKHILIVEDNSMNRVLYQMTLQLQGAYLDFDRWGRDALTKLQRSSNWDLIVLDLMLADGISGYDIFQEIRQMPEYDDTPIIAISASEPSVEIPKARQMGFSGYISKPVDEELISEQIAQVINGEPIWYDGPPRI